MIVTHDTIPPFSTANPDQKHHDERLIEYQTSLHEHIEQRVSQGEDPEAIADELEARRLHGQRIKDEWMQRFYGTKNVSANALLARISATTLTKK